MFSWMVRDLKRTNSKIGDEEVWCMYVYRPLEMGTGCEDICASYESSS